MNFSFLIPLLAIIGNIPGVSAASSLSNIVIEGFNYELVDEEKTCDFKNLTRRSWGRCPRCQHKIDCATECSIDRNPAEYRRMRKDNVQKCSGFVAFENPEDRKLLRCILVKEMTCQNSKMSPQHFGYLVKYYRRHPVKRNILEDEDYVSEDDVNEFVKVPAKRNVTETTGSAILDAFDPELCGNGKKRFLYDPHMEFAKAKIIGGLDASFGEFPFSVLLVYSYFNRETMTTQQFRCGGSVIDREWILSAAHCFPSKLIKGEDTNLTVSIGKLHTFTTDLNSEIKLKYVNMKARHRYLLRKHNGFNNLTFKNDLALLRIDPSLVNFSTSISPICLPNTSKMINLTNRVVVTTGYGVVRDPDEYPAVLQKLPRRILPPGDCKLLLGDGSFNSSNNICSSPSGRRDQCGGDSGGPWAVVEQPFGEKIGSKWTLVGVTSWGRSCGIRPGVAVGLNVPELSWIKKTATIQREPSTSQETQDLAKLLKLAGLSIEDLVSS